MVKRFNPDKRRRPKVDDYFGDWKWREALAETMVPLVGKLYRNGISILMYGRPLLNCSAVEIMKLHRFVREVEGNELSEIETFPVLESIAKMKLLPCEIDLGEIVSHLLENENLDPEKYVEKLLSENLRTKRSYPLRPKDIVLFGFGRIGRILTRLLIADTGGGAKWRLRAIVVRGTGNPDDLIKRASLLRHDSVHGEFGGTIRVNKENSSLIINGNEVFVIESDNPSKIDYKKYGIKKATVVDNTGVWRDEEGLKQHTRNPSVEQVILTAPGKGKVKNIVFGINDEKVKTDDKILAAASCTTNAIAPVLKLVDDNFKIVNGHIETVHAYTNDQNLIDNYHPSDRRGRSAALNLVITDTGAAKAVSEVLPELKGKLTANAIRVPTPNVSLAILNLTLKRGVGVDEINDCFRKAAFRSKLRETIDYTNSIDAVSSDFYSNEFAVVYDSQATISNFSNVTIYCWYDNEYGYTKQVVRLLKKVIGAELTRYPKQ
ncbi:MAG: glyceraldehyde-3-phosphate dehydrogenase [Pseudomonadota bacterium]|nr:glyceraldehyde-3-phosphate dehydrogenase [Pseudomonadota bacterium]